MDLLSFVFIVLLNPYVLAINHSQKHTSSQHNSLRSLLVFLTDIVTHLSNGFLLANVFISLNLLVVFSISLICGQLIPRWISLSPWECTNLFTKLQSHNVN